MGVYLMSKWSPAYTISSHLTTLSSLNTLSGHKRPHWPYCYLAIDMWTAPSVEMVLEVRRLKISY